MGDSISPIGLLRVGVCQKRTDAIVITTDEIEVVIRITVAGEFSAWKTRKLSMPMSKPWLTTQKQGMMFDPTAISSVVMTMASVVSDKLQLGVVQSDLSIAHE